MSATTWPDPAVESVTTWQPLWPGGAATAGGGPARRWAARPDPTVVVRAVAARGRAARRARATARGTCAVQVRRRDRPARRPRHGRRTRARRRTRRASGSRQRRRLVRRLCFRPSVCRRAAVVAGGCAAHRRVRRRRRPHHRAMLFASGPVDAPEFVTAWQPPPDTPAQEPVAARTARVRRGRRVGGRWRSWSPSRHRPSDRRSPAPHPTPTPPTGPPAAERR